MTNDSTTSGLSVPGYAMDIANALPDRIRKLISWHEIKQMHDAGLVTVGRCKDCKSYAINGEWRWCQEDNLSTDGDEPLSPDGYCSDFEPKEAGE